MKNFSDRVRYIRESLGYSPEEFASHVNTDRSTIYKMEAGTYKGTGEKVVDFIVLKWPQIDKEWVMTGEGKIPDLSVENFTKVEEPKPEYVVKNNRTTEDPQGNIYEINDYMMAAGQIWGKPDMEAMTGLKRHRIDGLNSGPYIMITVQGSSMKPKFNPNDKVILKPLSRFDIIDWGEPYAIATPDEILFKRIADETNTHLILTSDNKESNPKPMELSKSKDVILGIAKYVCKYTDFSSEPIQDPTERVFTILQSVISEKKRPRIEGIDIEYEDVVNKEIEESGKHAAICVTDESGELIYINDAFTEQTGYGPEVIGRKPGEILHGPGTDKIIIERMAEAIEKKTAFDGELINYNKKREPLVCRLHFHPETSNGRTIYVSRATFIKFPQELTNIIEAERAEAEEMARRQYMERVEGKGKKKAAN